MQGNRCAELSLMDQVHGAGVQGVGKADVRIRLADSQLADDAFQRAGHFGRAIAHVGHVVQ
jgi:hypothetical protein